MCEDSTRILYYDCFSGISGDMNLGAMIDLGVEPDFLSGELNKLTVPGWELKVKKDMRRGIQGTKAEVIIQPAKGHAHHVHRNLRDIETIINNSSLSSAVKKTSLDIFTLIARSEAKVHGKDLYEIHFHEVGAIDSIVDIVGAAVCLDYLKPAKIMASPVELGGGFVKCAHGILPVPAPATVEILKNIPVKYGAVPFETTTPTGAAILACTVSEFTSHIEFIIEKTGYGIGNRDTEIPNMLRVYLGKKEPCGCNEYEQEQAVMIECNMDDMNPETYDYIMEKLFRNGAADVFLTPIIMKKSRPAVMLSVLCSHGMKEKIKETVFLNTSSIGMREYCVQKTMLKRDFTEIIMKFGKITLKNAYYKGMKIHSKPEYEECKKLAEQHNVSIREIYNAVQNYLSAHP